MDPDQAGEPVRQAGPPSHREGDTNQANQLDEVTIVTDTCKRVEQLLDALQSRQLHTFSEQAQQQIMALKGKLLNYVTTPDQHKQSTPKKTVSQGKYPVSSGDDEHPDSDYERHGRPPRKTLLTRKQREPTRRRLQYEYDSPQESNPRKNPHVQWEDQAPPRRGGLARAAGICAEISRSSESDEKPYQGSHVPHQRMTGHRPQSYSRVPPVREQVHTEHVSSTSTEDRLIQALERLDTRSVPCPELFEMNSGQSIIDFFHDFETYCKQSFRTSENTWTLELGRYLSGELKQAFEALRGPNDTYRHVKTKLLSWYEDSYEHCQLGRKAAFNEARVEPDESLRLYAARLERLFKLAYPKRDIDTSKVLREKFIKTIPRKSRQQINSALAIAKTMAGESLPWSRIIALASHMDLNKHMIDTEPEEDRVYAARSPTLFRGPAKVAMCDTGGTVFKPTCK